LARRARDVGVVVAAGGRGRRLGGRLPKQFLRLGTKTVLEVTLEQFQRHRLVGEIVVVVPESERRRTERIVRGSRLSKVSSVVAGGKERQDSVREGLAAFRHPPRFVLVHDAVRPFIEEKTITAVVRGTIKYRAAVVGTPVKDTVKLEGRRGFYTKTLSREHLWAVQTPQGFSFHLIDRAHRAARKAGFVGTDEASLVERLGVPVRIIIGNERNMKITTRGDLKIARMVSRRKG
jgi:2-C-methyl-D-erythritol 4-phosphate cytidylyltransferase